MDLLNLISMFADGSAVTYRKQGMEALTGLALGIAGEIYEQLKAKGFYNE